MKVLLKILSTFFIASLLCACGEEEYVYPDVLTEFVCLKTNEQGKGAQLITDEGKTWEIPESQRPSDKLTPDSIYRVVSKYVTLPDTEEADVYALQSVIAPLPKAESEFEDIHTDAVTIQSIWRSGDYLNLILQVMVKDKAHEYGFIDEGITTNEDGSRTLKLTLFHYRDNDVEGFYRKAYLSVPLWHYQDVLTPGDLITFQLNTYKEGMTSRTFIY